ncbi:hypothetical protein H8356DRAFT_1624074 [Neocallimastix lanati (nom. inval.)]|jgi:hypothetical protein|uniref:Cyclin N-terminal domain-containing protein n=1 Tax=Neocallimastix californiae TaxID=1754190 RepID=A0A1Y2E5P0_9FUNG|nr:hypothetical protein H8356DRAFT_1624074 [Neocallimastix sp. JGI-2020a]ORY66883.1 hypothetical protein LY90DRAFT_667815 [Neocallimastix californiae]|eukprot:ORY66883.1 hypothetical protein LY90DRAFT_667815 [Neocallimastix californiae]
MEPEYNSIPLATSAYEIEAEKDEIIENTLKFQTFNKNEIKYLYHSLINNCIYFLETTYKSLYSDCTDPINHQEFHTYIENILLKTRITIPMLYSIMYYIKRFRTAIRQCPTAILGLREGLTINQPKDIQKVFVSAAILSIKFFNDRVIMNSEWTKFIDLTKEQINICEVQFVRLIDYNLNLNVRNYYTFINDYLTKFNKTESLTKVNSPSTITISQPVEQTLIQQKPLTINCNKIPYDNHSIYNTQTEILPTQPKAMSVENLIDNSLSINNTSSNAFLSITPTPSVGQTTPNSCTNERLLTPVEKVSMEMNYNSNTNAYSNYNCYNNNNYQIQMNQQRVLFKDPMSIGEQTSPECNSQYSNNHYSYPNTMMRTTSDSTFVAEPNYDYNNERCTTPNSVYGSEDSINNNVNNNNRDKTMFPTPKNNYSALSYSSCSSECTLYQSNPMDEDANMNQNHFNNRIPLNKLLYHNRHRHNQDYLYSKKGKIEMVKEEIEQE